MRTVVRVAVQAWLPLSLLGVWAIVANSSDVLYFPPLGDVFESLKTLLRDNMQSDLLPSLRRFALGFTAAVVAGIILGLALGSVRILDTIFGPIVHFMRAVPPPALVPLAIVVLGIGEGMKVWVIAFGAAWPVVLNTIDAIRALDPTMLEMVRSYKIGIWSRVFSVALPGATPQILAGMRTALAVSMLLTVVSEMIGSTDGIGFQLLSAQQQFAFADVWAGILILSCAGFVLNLAFEMFERRFARWYFASKGPVHVA